MELGVRILLVGRTERGHVEEGFQHYLRRCGRMASVEAVVLPEHSSGPPGQRQRAEGERILAALKPSERLIVLDERGELLSSVAFAARLGAWRDGGARQLAFAIGGAFGHADEVRARADLRLSLSPMTFPHQLVRVLFAEQLYRALMILNGRPYHH
ncbi:MAG: 23S rRNA (pseudouridine(1915)-N(3))-methyltransferase RlmH [Flavobacteriales bacterium]